MSHSIAIDGPAGAGKSTIARALAKSLGFTYVDTGAMYRAIALKLVRDGVDGSDEQAVARAIKDITVDIAHRDGEQVVYLCGEDVTASLRTGEVSRMASVSSALPVVRASILDLQRHLGETSDVIMDGRDIGTVVLPGAELKVFLTASVHVRALRRYDELRGKGEDCDLKEIEREIAERDERDMTRAISPLKKADDAIELDTSELTIDEVVERMRELYRERTGA